MLFFVMHDCVCVDNMEKVNQLKLLQSLANVQGISVVVNTGTTTSAPAPQATTPPAPSPSLIPTIETSIYAPKVNQFVDNATILIMVELTLLLISTKRALDEDQQSPQNEGSPKLTRDDDDGTSREVTPLTRISYIFSSRISQTLEEAAITVATLNMSFIQNIPEERLLALGNPTMERDTWKGKCETMELRCCTLQKELIAL